MEDSVEDSRYSGSHDKSAFECLEQKQGTNDSESDESVDHPSKCPDHQNLDHWDDHDLTSGSLESPPVRDVGTQPIQCTEDQLHRGNDVECCLSEGHQHSQVEVSVDDIDLPHTTSERRLSEHSIHKKTKLKCVTDSNNEKLADEKELRLKYTGEEMTNKKLSLSSLDDNGNLGPLEIERYLKPYHTLPNWFQNLCVCMLPSFSTQVSPQVFHLQSENDSSGLKKYLSEMSRLATYTEYPSTVRVFAIILAGDGFIFVPNEQLVKCVFCNLCISLSELSSPGADPVKLHQDRAPQCPLKHGLSCRNVPVPQIDENGVMANNPGHSVIKDNSERSAGTTEGKTYGHHGSRDEGSVDSLYQAQESAVIVQPSPVIRHQPEPQIVSDSVPCNLQLQPSDSPPRTPPNPPPKTNSDTVVQQARFEQPNLPSNPSSASRNNDTPASRQQPESAAVPANRVKSNNVESSDRSRPNKSPSGSGQNGASSSAASNQTKNAKSAKKTKSAKKAEASNRKTSAASAAATASNSSAQNASNKSNSLPGDKGEPNKEKKKLTFQDLGICADKAKRADMGTLQKRLGTFEGKWKNSYAKTPLELAECGMYYAGYADCARCFFCGGGLKNWETPDEPWVEHARWFPKCAYLRLCKGPMFVDIVQRKNKTNEKIIVKDVEEEIKQKTRNAAESASSLPVAVSVSESNESSVGGRSSPGLSSRRLAEELSKLEAEHEELNTQVQCKICMDEKSAVVFLPCGHMVACTNCAVLLKNCPFCRSEIKGTVKAYMD